MSLRIKGSDMRIFFMILGLMVLGACSAAPVDDAPINGGPDDNWRVVGLGEACGGMAGIMCEGEPSGAAYCAYAPAAQCGAADQMGTCTARPQMCTREYRPVCGCDGQTYGNACTAASAGVSVAHEGECQADR